MNRLPDRLPAPRMTLRPWRAEEAALVSRLSLDADNRRFLPDEVFETPADAAATIAFLQAALDTPEGPYVFAMDVQGIGPVGHVEAARIGEGRWELGFHVGADHRGHGYAAEAAQAFVPQVMAALALDTLYGVCCAENTASAHVLEKCGFTLLRCAEEKYQGVRRPVKVYTFQR